MKRGGPETIFPFAVALCAVAFFCLAATYRLDDIFLLMGADENIKHLLALKTAARLWGEVPIRFAMEIEDSASLWMMYSPYEGWTWVYAGVVSIALLGKCISSFMAFKLVSVLAGVVTLCSVFFVVSRRVSHWAAALTVFLLGTNAMFIIAVRHGFVREEGYQVCGLWTGVMLCQLAVDRKKPFLLYAGFFVFGLMLWAKMIFAAYILGGAAALIVMGRKRAAALKTLFPSLQSAGAALAAFVIGKPVRRWRLRNVGFELRRVYAGSGGGQ